MDTSRILSFRHPSQLSVLTDSLLDSSVHAPEGAAAVRIRSDLPSALQRIAIQAGKLNKEWRAWARGDSIRFLTVELAPELPKHPKCAVVMLRVYTAVKGAIKGTARRSLWVYTRAGAWLRVA